MTVTFMNILTLTGVLVWTAAAAMLVINVLDFIGDVSVPWFKRKMKRDLPWDNHVWRKPEPPATTLDIPGGPNPKAYPWGLPTGIPREMERATKWPLPGGPYSPVDDSNMTLPKPPVGGSAESSTASFERCTRVAKELEDLRREGAERPDPRAVRLAEEFESFRRDKEAALAYAKQTVNPENPDCPCSAEGCPCDIFGYSEVDDWPEDFDGCICTCGSISNLADDNDATLFDDLFEDEGMTVDEYIGATKRNPVDSTDTSRIELIDKPTLDAIQRGIDQARRGEGIYANLTEAWSNTFLEDEMALGGAICAVANHSTPPTDVPCPACLNFAIVILTKLDDTGYGLVS